MNSSDIKRGTYEALGKPWKGLCAWLLIKGCGFDVLHLTETGSEGMRLLSFPCLCGKH